MPEVDKFLQHLEAQTYRDFELLMVDQNPGTAVSELLKRHAFPQKYFTPTSAGLHAAGTLDFVPCAATSSPSLTMTAGILRTS